VAVVLLLVVVLDGAERLLQRDNRMGLGVKQRLPWSSLVVCRLVEERKLGLDQVLGSE
jgi:hypothetical protein